jgi:hypothetical protein
MEKKLEDLSLSESEGKIFQRRAGIEVQAAGSVCEGEQGCGNASGSATAQMPPEDAGGWAKARATTEVGHDSLYNLRLTIDNSKFIFC